MDFNGQVQMSNSQKNWYVPSHFCLPNGCVYVGTVYYQPNPIPRYEPKVSSTPIGPLSPAVAINPQPNPVPRYEPKVSSTPIGPLSLAVPINPQPNPVPRYEPKVSSTPIGPLSLAVPINPQPNPIPRYEPKVSSTPIGPLSPAVAINPQPNPVPRYEPKVSSTPIGPLSLAVPINPQPNPVPRYEPEVSSTPIGPLSPAVANQDYISTRKLSSTELLSSLHRRRVQDSNFTRGLIKAKFNGGADSEIATTSLRVSLACPLGKMRMVTPCRASTCLHLQCFDALLFLQMNERKPTWNCPVCDKPALFDTLVIDAYFQEVLNSEKLLPDANEIQLLQDGSWQNLVLDKTETNVIMNIQDREIDVDIIDLDETNPAPPKVWKREWKRDVVIDLTSDRDDYDYNYNYDYNYDYDYKDNKYTTPQSTSGSSWPKESQASFVNSKGEILVGPTSYVTNSVLRALLQQDC